MADPAATETIPQVEDSAAVVLAEEHAVAEAAAAHFFDDQKPAEEKPDRPRDPTGRFASTKPTEPTGETETPENPPAETPPVKVSGVWQEAARQVGLSDDEIAKFNSDAEAQQQVSTKRISRQVEAIQTLGIDPQDFGRYVEWRNNQANGQQTTTPRTTTQPTPTVATTLDDLNLNIDENELAPEVAQQLKAIVEYTNKLKASYVGENQKLQQTVNGLQAQVQQSVAARDAVEREAREAVAWDQAASAVPGFVQYFGGKPSDLKKMAQANPNNPRIADALAFDNYLLPKLDEYIRIIGDNEKARQLALQDAWAMSPFSRVNGSASPNGTNGANRYGPGSVPRGAPRRGTAAEPTPGDGDIQAEYDRLMNVVGQQWDNAGGNPYA